MRAPYRSLSEPCLVAKAGDVLGDQPAEWRTAAAAPEGCVVVIRGQG
jgi:hypothetical protein